MSTIKAGKVQAGISLTPANNFILDASADDGTVTLKRADGTAVLQVDASGNLLGLGASDPDDATANRLLQFGDFGVGSSIFITELNDAPNGPSFAGGTAGNVPEAGGAVWHIHTYSAPLGTSSKMQIATTLKSSTYPMYVRYYTGSAWSGWNKMYNQTTILGTVGQSSGVPTGAIIERGSNSNGEYVKYADGTRICRHGSTSSNSAAATWTFPAAFSATPEYTGAAPLSSLVAAYSGVVATEATTNLTFSMFKSDNTRGFISVRLLAIGKWF